MSEQVNRPDESPVWEHEIPAGKPTVTFCQDADVTPRVPFMHLHCTVHNWYGLLSRCTLLVGKIENNNVPSANTRAAVVEKEDVSSVEAGLHAL